MGGCLRVGVRVGDEGMGDEQGEGGDEGYEGGGEWEGRS